MDKITNQVSTFFPISNPVPFYCYSVPRRSKVSVWSTRRTSQRCSYLNMPHVKWVISSLSICVKRPVIFYPFLWQCHDRPVLVSSAGNGPSVELTASTKPKVGQAAIAAISRVPSSHQTQQQQHVTQSVDPVQDKAATTKRWVLEDFDIGKPLGKGCCCCVFNTTGDYFSHILDPIQVWFIYDFSSLKPTCNPLLCCFFLELLPVFLFVALLMLLLLFR